MKPFNALRMRTASGGYLTNATTFSPLFKPASLTLSNGNLTATGSLTGTYPAMPRDAKVSGKYYCEWRIDAHPSGTPIVVGLTTPYGQNLDNTVPMQNLGVAYYENGTLYRGAVPHSNPGSYTAGDVIGMEADLDARTVRLRKNGGAWTANIAIPATGAFSPACCPAGSGVQITANFGASAWHTNPTAGYTGWTVNSTRQGRYWRIRQESGARAEIAFISEIAWRIAAGGANQISGGTASASSQYDATFAIAKAIDGTTSTGWSTLYGTSNGNGGWWQYDFGSGVTKAIIEMALSSRADYADYMTRFAVFHSDDATSWFPAYYASGLSWTLGETKTFNWA